MFISESLLLFFFFSGLWLDGYLVMRAERLEVKRQIGFLLLALGAIPLMGELRVRDSEAKELVTRLEVSPAGVGQPSQIRWLLSDPKTGKPVTSRLTLAITHLEKEKRIFFLNKIQTNGDFTFSFHFTDGSAHRITSVAEVEGMGPMREERTITVTGVDPPRVAVLRSLFFFLAVIALGLVIGRMSRRKRLKSL